MICMKTEFFSSDVCKQYFLNVASNEFGYHFICHFT